MKIDLHMHSNASDGELSPEELVDLAVSKRLEVIAITDHEVVDGSVRAIEYSSDKDVEVVSGIEIGANDEGIGVSDVHIVGLFLDLENKELLELSEKLMKAREVQKKEMIVKLNSIGYDVSFDELVAEVNGVNYGRPHIASILIRKYPDEFRNIKSVFDKLLGYGCPADVLQWKDTIKNTVDIIHGAGGVAVLAHPLLLKNFERVVDRFVECGGDGIEVDYFYGNRKNNGREKELEKIKKALKIAQDKELLISGGGDFHRRMDPHEIGDYGVSKKELEALRKASLKYG